MIKFLSTKPDGRKVLGLGLSAENLDRLSKDQPIHFTKEDLKLPGIRVDEVFIFYGETDETLEAFVRSAGNMDGAIVTKSSAVKPH